MYSLLELLDAVLTILKYSGYHSDINLCLILLRPGLIFIDIIDINTGIYTTRTTYSKI